MANDKPEREHVKRVVTSEPLRDPTTGHVRMSKTIQILTEDLDESQQRVKELEASLAAERKHTEALQQGIETLQTFFSAMTRQPVVPASKQLEEEKHVA